jgi:hypothetical protein
MLARQKLEKFPDFPHGEIDIESVRDTAYSIGYALSEEELNHLQKASFVLANRASQLSAYIGLEVAYLIKLCMAAYGLSPEEYRSDDGTKGLCSSVATALRARTDNEEYVVPLSPRSAERQTNLKTSVPALTSASAAIVQASRNMPEQDKLPGASTQNGDSSSLVGTSARSGGSRSLGRSVTGASSEVMVEELKAQQKRQLPYSMTLPARSPQQQQDAEYGSPYRPATAQQKPDSEQNLSDGKKASSHSRSVSNTAAHAGDAVKKSSQEKRKLHRSMQYAAPPRLDTPEADSDEQHFPASEKPAEREYKARRADQKAQRLSQPSVRELKEIRKSSSSRKQEIAGEAINASGPASLAPQYDNALMDKWTILEQRLGLQFTTKAKDAVKRLLSFCQSLDLQQLDKAALSEVVVAAGLTKKDREALIQARNVLLADSQKGKQASAATIFPDLLALLVFAVDAHRSLIRAKS